jgi:P-type Cu+ transporter
VSTHARGTSRLRLLERKWTEMARTLLEVPVRGMDCAACTMHVQRALAALPGVADVRVLLSAEKAVLQVDSTKVDLPTIRTAVEGAGYTVPESAPEEGSEPTSVSLATFTRPIFTLFGLVFGAVLLVVIVGEWRPRLRLGSSRQRW